MTISPTFIEDWLTAAYDKLTAAIPDFVARPQQRDLSLRVAKALTEGIPLTAEAPTGTGKTVAYLLGALAAHYAKGAGASDPIVVSTATKALQQQLVSNDLPKLVMAGLITPEDVAISKGKGNYLCLRQAEEVAVVLERGEQDPELFLGDSSAELDPTLVSGMVDALYDGRWDGDFDAYEGRMPPSVRPIAVSSDTCNSKKCEYYSRCAYYKAKAAAAGKKVLVANHDLVLRDLLLVSEDMEPTLPVANYMLVFDEAHHLPEKAIKVKATDGNVSALFLALPKLAGVQKILKGSPELSRQLAARHITEAHFDRVALADSLRNLSSELMTVDVDEESGQHRFAKGEVPAELSVALLAVQTPVSNMLGSINALTAFLREAQGSLSDPIQEKANELMRRALDLKYPLESLLEAVTAFLRPTRVVKWLYRKEATVTIHTAPLEGADVLKPLLWDSKRTQGVVMTSATLRDIGGFSRFASRAGIPPKAHFMVLPYTFPYEKSVMVVAAMNATPKPAERRFFLTELREKLPKEIKPREGTLILFPSWAMLREFGPLLKARFGEERVKVQGEHTTKMLVKAHCAAIDSGEGSILMGVATLSEGLDLPGKYCTHVAIVALPFAVPSDPVEQEIAERLGPKYFSERSLPDAMVRLTQMVGRLLRRESDIGRITLFDRRLASTSYGKQMLRSLPPFQKVIEPLPTPT